MNFYAISALVNFITSFTLGIFVIFKSRKSKNFSFFIFCFFVAFWSLGYYFWQISTTAAEALFWSRALMASAIFIPVAYLQFVYALVEILERKKRFIIFSYFLFFIFFLINFTPYFVSHLEPLLNFKFWPIAGPLYSLFLAVWFFYIIYSTYLLYRKYRTSSGIIRLQIRYVIMGMIIGFAGGSTNYFLWYRIPIPPVANILVSVYVGAITYAIVRYRLMDIRFVLGRGAIYFFSFVVVVSSALGLISLNEQSGQPLSASASGALIIIFSILLFQLSFKFFEKLASRYFFYTFYSYQTVLTELGEKLTRVLDLDKLSFLIVNTLIKTMKLDRTVILLKEEGNGDYQIQKNIGFKEENGISLVKNNFLTTYLEKNQKPVVYEELSLIIKDTYQGEDKERLEELRNNMKKIEAALCLPLLMENKIIGMIVLGSKISGEPYSTQDINLLTALANQASISLQNAKLYDQVHDLSENLQEKVDEQIQELRKAYEELKKLDQAKSEFISIASHQLRTPLTTIKGYISMILEKSYGQMSRKIKKPLENINVSNERLIKLVNDLLSVSRIEAGKIELDLAKVSIEKTIAEVIDELAIIAEKKKIYLKFKKAKKPLPEITADKDKIRQVIINLIDNAIRYTNQGGITVTCRTEKAKYRIEITDTGEGMTKEEISKLFESFSRGKAGPRFWTEGAGLGLYIAKKFVEMHQGKIWVESAGKNKGSTFYIELPINNTNL